MSFTGRLKNMLEINFNQRKIEIDLPNGVYNLGILSGTGKTYLCNAFKYLGSHGYPVRGYDYEDYLDGKSLKSYINNDNVKYIFIDRYDLYTNELLDDIQELGKNCVVLIDIKRLHVLDIDTLDAEIYLTKNKVVVYSTDSRI